MRLLPSLPKKYKGPLAGCVVALLLFVAAAIYGDHGLMHLLRLREDQHALEQRAFALQQRNEQLRQQSQRLESDDWYLEKLAREHLGSHTTPPQ